MMRSTADLALRDYPAELFPRIRTLASQRIEWDDTPPLRARVEDEIERLIALLDTLDGDENLEPWLDITALT